MFSGARIFAKRREHPFRKWRLPATSPINIPGTHLHPSNGARSDRARVIHDVAVIPRACRRRRRRLKT
jgi:hypothetical protein